MSVVLFAILFGSTAIFVYCMLKKQYPNALWAAGLIAWSLLLLSWVRGIV